MKACAVCGSINRRLVYDWAPTTGPVMPAYKVFQGCVQCRPSPKHTTKHYRRIQACYALAPLSMSLLRMPTGRYLLSCGHQALISARVFPITGSIHCRDCETEAMFPRLRGPERLSGPSAVTANDSP